MVFDPAAVTKAKIDSLGPDALAKAADYTQGGHWLILWGLVVAAFVTWIVVRLRLLDRLDSRLTVRWVALKAFLLCATFFLLSAIISLPWDVYAGWAREAAYGRTSQPFADWLGQSAMSSLISALLSGLFFVGIYWLIRRTGKRWWIWSGGLAAVAISTLLLLSPILIEPLFNEYKPVPAGPVRDALEGMADRANIPHDHIVMFDGSRQSNNFSANVAGIGSSARIAISDVALGKASLDEVKAVTGHEIGHYVEGHIWWAVLVFSVLAVLIFFLVDRLFPRAARLFGSDTRIEEARGIPVMIFLVSLLGALAMPVVNTLVRIDEASADQYSLEMVNLPDAMVGALLKSAEYRNPRPGALEEFLFYDHPSVERRIRMSMDWKAAHPPKPK
jgi:STE24 endopeptidase